MKNPSKFVHPKFNLEPNETTWRFPYEMPGAQIEEVVIDWDFDVGKKGRFTDPENRIMLLEFQNFLQTSITADDAGIRMEVGSITATFMGLRML